MGNLQKWRHFLNSDQTKRLTLPAAVASDERPIAPLTRVPTRRFIEPDTPRRTTLEPNR
ncbi:hypothetical protein RSSM_03944 [Rhodopirellula sallentina SM41]|uniref:Uncharacterized protein n=1 Tax=Rhodopirellula sallentina SM41 TaxID=1263870 RepID=M5TZI3_9BACT|nr:hypothetical protein RSSM_03944 [Rhodopirellula sallentina SM41]